MSDVVEQVARRAEVVLAPSWRWPQRRDDRAPRGPEPIRLAFRHMLEGGTPYRREDDHGA